MKRITKIFLYIVFSYWILVASIYLYENRRTIQKGFQDGLVGVYDFNPCPKCK